MLVQARFQIGNASDQLGNLLLLEGDDREGCQQELLHHHRRGSPVFHSNAGWWCARVHRSSMPVVGKAVK